MKKPYKLHGRPTDKGFANKMRVMVNWNNTEPFAVFIKKCKKMVGLFGFVRQHKLLISLVIQAFD